MHSRLLRMALCGLFATALSFCSKPKTGSMTTTTDDNRSVTVTAINDYAVKVTNTMPGQKAPATQAVVLDRQPFNGKITSDSAVATMTLPSGLTVTLDKHSGAVGFSGNGSLMLADYGVRQDSDSLVSISLAPADGSAFYGAGERGHSLKLNGDTLVMYNKQNYGYMEGESRISQMNICMPYFVSDDGYGVLFDDHAAAEMVMSDPIEYISEAGTPISYYFIYGSGSIAETVSRFTELTGRQELPPFWALGYITSKYGYKTEAETRQVVDSLKGLGYPLDGVVLDLYWYGQETDMGRLEWNEEQWPDHKKMLSDLKDKGVNTVLISQPYINKIGAIDNYNELKGKGLLTHDKDGNVNDVTTWVGEAGMFDVANPATKEWLRNRYRALTDEGVGGWWGDLGEPEVHPETIVHHNGMTTRQFHNVYGNVWSSIIHDLYKQEYPNTRLMTLMRGGTTGLQRYSVFPWSTDVSRTWGGLQPQVKIMLNSGLSGLGYMSHDVGGFAITDEENVTDPELYVRWMQLGAFSPVLRTHAQQFAEPFHYPAYNDMLLDLVMTRYRWLPYNYTLAYENTTKGYPLVRPLNFSNKSDSALDNVSDQYLWGNEVMVAPVMQKGAVSRSVIIPAGEWIDYNNPEVSYQGIDTISYDAPLSVLPLFVRAGAIIPLADYDMSNVGDFDPSRYTILYYPRGGVESQYAMFEDDRKSTTSIARKDYALMDIMAADSEHQIDISVELKGDYPGMPDEKSLTFVLPGISPTKIGSATVNETRLSVTKDPEGYASFTVSLTRSAPLKIILTKK
ncbi:MAG: DUF5110 domain-containing protein [Muribaculum sp.]|nr:DUF5110 domain-containing protein [Muribaculum sp.]